MPLRTLIEPNPETVNDLVLAAEARYFDAYELAAQSLPFPAIYLAGFTAEMLLKTAGFIFDGALPGDPIKPRLYPAKTFGQAYFPTVPYESYHSLRFWVSFLEHKRIVAANPMSAALLAELQTRTDRVAATWWIEMRYRPSAPVAAVAQAELLGLLDDVDWMMKNHSRFWS